MTEGTQFAKLEALIVDLQKTQRMMDEYDKLGNMDERMGNMGDTMRSFKESFIHMEEMMKRFVQTHITASPYGSSVQNNNEEISLTSLFYGK